MFTYLCPHCLGVFKHYGTMLALHPNCPEWAIAVGWKDNLPLTGMHLDFIPDREGHETQAKDSTLER